MQLPSKDLEAIPGWLLLHRALPGFFLVHPPVKDDGQVKKIHSRYQRTITRPVHVQGTGYLTGAQVHLRFVPAPPCTGVVFVRTDLRGRTPLQAHIDQVTGTQRRTTLGTAPHQVGLVEHVLAALAGLKIDNCLVELDAPEPPGLDGSAWDFVDGLLQVGIRTQPALRSIWTVDEALIVSNKGATIALHPYPGQTLKVSYLLDYGIGSPLGWQCCTRTLTPATFTQDLARSRTFILESEVEALRDQGLGQRTTARDLLVFGRRGPIDNKLHHADEPARHKLLDIVGDLSLLGVDLAGHLVAYRSGHPLNIELVRALQEQMKQGSAVPVPQVA
jgi:UDP-3-O-acyl N-acetylglucosamine deacetylase